MSQQSERAVMTRRSFVAGLGGALLTGNALACAENWPQRAITLVVPSVAGNVNDAVGRLLGQELTKRWNQAVVVDNRPGAGAVTGTRSVARAANDGYTALLTFTTHVQNPALYPQVGYDPIADFEAVSLIAKSWVMLAVTPGFAPRTVQELVQTLAAAPGQYAYGSYGVGTTGHIFGELFNRQIGLNIAHIPYKGGAPLTNDLAAGHIPMGMVPVGTAMPLLQAGRIIPLAISGTQRSTLLPQIPTFAELGYAGFELDAWMGMLLPKGSCADIAERLSQEIARIVRQPTIIDRLHSLNLEPVGSTTQAFAATLRSDAQKWGQLIQQLNIHTQ